jgi:Spy/CpxP family protein refolding chaperone
MTSHRKTALVLWLIATLAAGGWALTNSTHAAGPFGGALTDEGPARPLRMFLSGQFGRLLELRSELELTTEQRTQIRDVVKNHRAEIAVALQPVVERRRALREATLAANVDEAAIRTAATDLGKAIGDAAVVGAKVKAEVRAVLTPEQQKKLDEFRGESDAAIDSFLDEAAGK